MFCEDVWNEIFRNSHLSHINPLKCVCKDVYNYANLYVKYVIENSETIRVRISNTSYCTMQLGYMPTQGWGVTCKYYKKGALISSKFFNSGMTWISKNISICIVEPRLYQLICWQKDGTRTNIYKLLFRLPVDWPDLKC